MINVLIVVNVVDLVTFMIRMHQMTTALVIIADNLRPIQMSN